MGASNPAVSIVVPLFNVEDFVVDCIESLACQTYHDFEVLLVDDGSTDRSVEIARSLVGDDPRFRFFAKENGGLSSARNFGIEHACGTYLAFLDSDDYYTLDAIEQLVTFASAHNLDYVDFTAHSFYDTAKARRLRNEDYYEKRPVIPGVMSGPELFVAYQRHREYHCSACFHFFKRELLEPKAEAGRARSLRFMERIIHEDELFSPLLIARAKRAAYLPLALYQRRVREGSIMTEHRGMKNIVGMFTVQQELRRFAVERSHTYGGPFADALCQRVSELRDIIAQDALGVAHEELAAYEETLSGEDCVEFNLVAVQGARRLALLHSSYEHRIGTVALAFPRLVKRALS